MGLSDSLICDYPLPDVEVQHQYFQTKDLQCDLLTYRITEDGRLYCESEKPTATTIRKMYLSDIWIVFKVRYGFIPTFVVRTARLYKSLRRTKKKRKGRLGSIRIMNIMRSLTKAYCFILFGYRRIHRGLR